MSEKAKYDRLYRTNATYKGTEIPYGSGFHAEPVMDFIMSLDFDIMSLSVRRMGDVDSGVAIA